MMTLTRRKRGSGSIQLEERKSGPAVWIFRYWEPSGGDRHRHKVILGTVEAIPTLEDAERAAEPHRLIANRESPAVSPVTMEALIERYLITQLPAPVKLADQHTPVPDGTQMSGQCAKSYRSVIKCWIRPRWTKREDGRPYLVREFEHITMSTAIEGWLTSLLCSQRNSDGLAPKSVCHIFAVMKLIFKHAVKWGYISRNPLGNQHDKLVELPRGSTKRAKTPLQLTPAEFDSLLSKLGDLAQLAIAFTGWLGPRCSEAFGLKWQDIDFLNAVVRFRQGIVLGRITALKTEASRSELPLPKELVELLLAWRRLTPYRAAEDWVFASPATDGKRPYWHGQLLKDHIQPVARQLGLPNIGWHSLRHSYMAWGKAAGLATPALQQLLRDSTDQMVNQTYGATDVEAKRKDNRKVIDYAKRTAAVSKKEPGTIQ